MTTDARAAEGWVDPRNNPDKSNEIVDKLVNEPKKDPLPVIPMPPDDLVELPGGLVKGEKLYNTAIVRELTGVHEEQLARAAQSGRGNGFHFINTLLECGTVSIGDAPEKETKKLLKELLIGDREALILGIRRATYGNEIEIEGYQCPNCRESTNLVVTLDEIESAKLNDPRLDTTFEVKLRKGGKALVRLPTGEDQSMIYENPNNTVAQNDSILLSRCVLEIEDKDGRLHSVAGYPSVVRDMAIPDRRKILREMVKRQPGPRYDEIKFTHADCGEEVSLPIGIGDLFLDI